MIICMLLATVCFLAFTYFFVSAGKEIINSIIICLLEIEAEKQKKYQADMQSVVEMINKSGDGKSRNLIKKGRKIKKKNDISQKRSECLRNGKIGVLDLLPAAGYRVLQILKWDATNSTIKLMYNKCIQIKEKKEAMNYTYYVVGNLIGCFMLGICAFLIMLGLTLGMGMGTRGFVIAMLVLVVFVLMGYMPYDAVGSSIKKRKEEIDNQFPQAVSKMTLLTTAGIEVSKAWKLTCADGEGILYDEMRRVVVDLDNNESPAAAYSRFIVRCNNNYTTKFATAIMQNITKGNAEIVKLFLRLNDESWLEHKHNARRQGEKISSKLLIPTILMFLGILIMIIVPVMSGFNIGI